MEPCDILENRQKKLFGTLSYFEKETKIDDEGQEEGEKEVTWSNLCSPAQMYSEVTKSRTTSDKNLVRSPDVTSLEAGIIVYFFNSLIPNVLHGAWQMVHTQWLAVNEQKPKVQPALGPKSLVQAYLLSLLALESFPSRSLLKYSHILFSNIFFFKKNIKSIYFSLMWSRYFLYFYPTSEAIFLKSLLTDLFFSPVLLTYLPTLGQYHIVLVTIPS